MSRPDRYEVRAVWRDGVDVLVSQSIEQFDHQPMREYAPDLFGVYVIYGGHVEDHPLRSAAETHAAELNDAVRS